MNAVYPKFIQALLEGFVNLTGPDAVSELKLVAVGADYVYSTAHDTIEDLGSNIIGLAIPLTGVTFVGGIIDADDILGAFRDVVEPTVTQGIVFYFEWASGTALVDILMQRQTEDPPRRWV